MIAGTAANDQACGKGWLAGRPLILAVKYFLEHRAPLLL
jgi:hypothetical protein